MNISSAGLELIRRWEGSRLEAYADPVGIATIGYGTIAYPDGRPVCLGDRISQEQADGFLLRECERIVLRIEALLALPVSQNQFDALVSFSYNLGVGALADSTLLRLLNGGDTAGAAQEFPRWNKAMQGGVLLPLEGLSRRRRDEQRLFLSEQPAGVPIPLESTPSPQQRVRWLEAYVEGEASVIVGWCGAEVVEIVQLQCRDKRLLRDVLDQYPGAAHFVIAPAGKPIPPGERILVGPRSLTGGASGGAAPPPPGRLLLRGCSGDDVRTLQARLQALGYLQSVPAGVFGSATDAAVRRFQADALGPAEADGLVGAITWGCLWPGPVAAPAAPAPSGPPGAPGRTYLRLRRGHRRDPYGLEVLQLEYIRDGAPAGSLEVCSGQPGAQRFRSGAESRAGSMEPLPEGRWRIDDIVWCAGRDVYGPAVFASGLGPVSTPIAYAGPGRTERSAIEIHLDWNRKGAPGTAGCIGIHTLADYRLLVSWLRERDPRDLYVDWGLGSCPPP